MGEAQRRKKNPNTDIIVTSDPKPDLNKDHAEFEINRYMSNPKVGFWKSLKKAFGCETKWLNKKGEVLTVVLIVSGVVVLAAAGFLGMVWHGISQLGGR